MYKGQESSVTYQPGFLARLIVPKARWRLSLKDPCIIKRDGRQWKIPFVSVKDANISTHLLWWKKLIIRTDGDKAVFLPGLSSFAASKLRNAIARRVCQRLLIELDEKEITRRLDKFYRQKQYLANRDVNRWRIEYPATHQLGHALRHPLFDQNVVTSDLSSLFVQIEDLLGKRTKLHEHNEEFIKQERIHQADFFERVEKNPLTNEQRRAAIVMEDHHLLIASAGCGKTSAIVGKIGYALKKNFCAPSQIVTLAFNKNAANELRQRINERLGNLNGHEVKVETFHALGLQFISEAKGIKPRVADWAANLGENPGQIVEGLVSELLKANPSFGVHWANFLSHFHWEMKPLYFFHSRKEYELYLFAIRAARLAGNEVKVRTIKGDNVRSLEECAIANWLYVNGIQYEYERDYEHDLASLDHSQYRPDFYYPQADVYHEHLALDQNGRPPEFFSSDYIDGVQWKRQMHQQHGTQLIETTSAMFRNGTIFDHLAAGLKRYGAFEEARPPSPKAIIKRISEDYTTPLYSLMRTFLSHWKSTGATEEVLRSRLVDFSGFERLRAEAFLNVIIPLREIYDRKLRDNNELDFDDMLAQASDALRDGRMRHPYKLILVDEFQDISWSRAEMLRAMLEQNPDCKLFAVGDDWQAIYRFAGADVLIMTNFRDEFDVAAEDQLTQNFRSNQGIVNVASQFVQKNPSQITKEIRAGDSLCEGVVHVVYYQRDEYVWPFVKAKLSEIVTNGGTGNKSVYILARYNSLCLPQSQLLKWRESYSELDIQCMTIHKSKGLEADYVIVLGMNSGRHSFPCEIEDDPILKLVMPKVEPFEFAEERRLFYVALTRAKRKVILLTQQDRPSRFIKEIIDNGNGSVTLERIQAKGKTSPCQICPQCKTGFLTERKGSFGLFMGCSTYPLCSHTQQTSTQERLTS